MASTLQLKRAETQLSSLLQCGGFRFYMAAYCCQKISLKMLPEKHVPFPPIGIKRMGRLAHPTPFAI